MKRNIEFTRQGEIEVQYDDDISDVGFRADIIMEGKLLIEIKSPEQLENVHHKTVLTYLIVSGIKLGLLIKFKVNLIKDGIYRKINGQLDRSFAELAQL